jgi:beta-phosphoglucomutase-like phosphatase (HAD superfamily)
VQKLIQGILAFKGKHPMSELSSLITPERFDAALFDLDGVLTATASIDAACWKEMFDECLQRRSRARGEAFQPFDLDSDYKPYLDGKPRHEGRVLVLAIQRHRAARGRCATSAIEMRLLKARAMKVDRGSLKRWLHAQAPCAATNAPGAPR